MHDGGAIYTLGAQPGSSSSHNLIEHTGGASQGNPLYTDQSSSGLTIAANVIDDCTGTRWWVWGANAFASGLTIADNVVNSPGISAGTLSRRFRFPGSTVRACGDLDWIAHVHRDRAEDYSAGEQPRGPRVPC
ncbi:hypothetical protein KXS11_00540 [Plantibacter flavus]|uniref:hypothetical protein n=1 Tax=Plantibacter flavus TaxID=150123 RepID=UPI003F18422E